MTHDKIIKLTESKAHQRSLCIIKGIWVSFKSGESADRPVFCFQASSLSVCTGGRAYWETDPDPGGKEHIYGKALFETCQISTGICEHNRPKYKRGSHSGLRGIYRQGAWSWLNVVNLIGGFNWSIVLTGYQKLRSFRFTSHWCPIRFGCWEKRKGWLRKEAET